MATINLGSIKFNWKGSYSGATAYVVDDVVESSGSSYICIAATTGNAPPNASYWEQMSSAGTDGTDLTSTLTTQGDIVYRDASGLARLGAGTSGQVLQTNGTGANPSWGTVSSDFVKITNTSITSGTTVASFDNVFSSSDGYDSYQIIMRNIVPATDGVRLDMRLLDSSGNSVSANYYWNNSGIEEYGTGRNFAQMDGARNASEWQIVGAGGVIDNDTNNQGVSVSMNIYNPENSGRTQFEGHYVMIRGTNLDNLFGLKTIGVIEDGQVMRGFQLFMDSGNFASGSVTIYGRK